MYEQITYETLLRLMTETVINAARKRGQDVDTREGSLVWYGLAPTAVEMQNIYIQLDTILNETFADTATRPYLIKRAAERGIIPYAATHAVLEGRFTPAELKVTAGSRFSFGDLTYKVLEPISNGTYKVQCEQAGEVGNGYTGPIIPINYINGLENARLAQILIPGKDEEGTESIRRRYFADLNTQSFGGNIADYKEKVNALPGVGGVKVYRVWNGNVRPSELLPPTTLSRWLAEVNDIPNDIRQWAETVARAANDGLLTVGGAVRLVIIDSAWSKPSGVLVNEVQTAIDPVENHGEGVGIAPIGHYVTVSGVSETPVNIRLQLVYQDDWLWPDVQPYAEAVIDEYLKSLAKSWAESDNPPVVRVSYIESRLLSCPGVLDVTGTLINGESKNLVLGTDSIPVRGDLNG